MHFYDEERDPMDLSTKGTDSPLRTSPKAVASPSPVEEAIDPTGFTESDNHIEMVNFPCHTCDQKFASRAQQELHIAERHSRYDIWRGGDASFL